jgi:ribosomal protein S12 methylthiotransferase accessory factor
LAGQTVPALAGRHVSQSGSSLEAFVPQTAVDYPPKTQYDSKTFDPSPSGTASGTSRDDALERACKEVLERDAAMTAWIKRSCLDRVDIDGVEARVGDFKKLASRARILGLDFVLAYLAPTSNIAQPIMCMLFDEKNGVACAGLGLERDEANGAFRAFQEALQVRTVLLTRAEAARGQSVRYPVTDDEDRAAYWGSSQGIDAAHEWLRLVSRVPRALSGPRESVPWSTLVGERLEVDLTHRLPPRIKDMGWAVVKVMSPLLQPLRMSDAVSWNISNEEDRLTYNLLSSPHPYI